jgi:hypothetical protein
MLSIVNTDLFPMERPTWKYTYSLGNGILSQKRNELLNSNFSMNEESEQKRKQFESISSCHDNKV